MGKALTGKVSVFFVLLTAFIFAFAPLANADRVLKIYNHLDVDIYEIYISETGRNDWEEDVLENDVLEAGGELNVTMPQYRQFDLQIVDKNGKTYEYYGQPGDAAWVAVSPFGLVRD